MGVNGIYGLSGSGLDVESMVKVGMMSKQNQYDKMQQTYTLNEWKKEAYLDVYDKLQTYNTSTLSTFKLSQNMNARNATSSNAAIHATATAVAPVMTHTITVNQTATNAYLVGTKALKNSLQSTANNASSISFNIYDTIEKASSVSFAGNDTVKFDSDLMKRALLSDLSDNVVTATSVDKIALDSSGNVRFTITADATQGRGTSEISTSVTKSSADTAMSFTIDNNVSDDTAGTTVNITYGEIAKLFAEPGYDFEFNDFVSLLNRKTELLGLGITASYSSAGNGELTFTNNQNGGTVSVTMESGGDFGAQVLSKLSAGGIETDTWATQSNDTATVLGESKTISLDITSSTSYNDLAKAINNASTNIRATFDATNNKFSIYNKNSGESNIVGIEADDENAQAVFKAMGLKQSFGTSSSANALTFSAGNTSAVYAGKNASVVIDGEALTKESNNFTEKGINYDITNVTEKTTATIGVTQDVDKIVDNVKSFVESYNTLLSSLYDMYNETQNSSYKPLTDAQKAEMTEEQIEKWEKKAKSGMLYHDSTIRKIIDNMRNSISESVSTVNSRYNNAYSIGISTTGIYGQLTLDEDKLRDALTADPDSVYNVFATLQSTKADTETAAYSTKDGIAQRLGSIMTTAIKSINNVAGTSTDNSDDSTLSTLLRNLQSRMSSFRSMMDAFETKLYKKYDAMESSLAMLGSQLNYVTSAFA